jgi:hypothetical protein
MQPAYIKLIELTVDGRRALPFFCTSCRESSQCWFAATPCRHMRRLPGHCSWSVPIGHATPVCIVRADILLDMCYAVLRSV